MWLFDEHISLIPLVLRQNFIHSKKFINNSWGKQEITIAEGILTLETFHRLFEIITNFKHLNYNLYEYL